MKNATRPLLVLALVMLAWTTFMPGWWIVDATYWRKSWATWGAHACPSPHNDAIVACEFISFGDDDAGNLKLPGLGTCAGGVLMQVGLVSLVLARRKQPWMRWLVRLGGGLGLVMATWYTSAWPPHHEDTAGTVGPNFALYVVAAVLAMAVAMIESADPLGDLPDELKV